MVVYTGLLKLLDSDDELAAVLAHEAAHVVARHAVRSLACLLVTVCRITHAGSQNLSTAQQAEQQKPGV